MRPSGWVGSIVLAMTSVAGWGQSAPARVSAGAMAGQILERTDPVYPPIAKAARVSGAVILRVIIDETGHVASLEVVSGPEMLRQSALEAVRKWVYRPYVLNGEAIAVDTTVTVMFHGAEAQSGVSQEAAPLGMVREGETPEPKSVMPVVTNTFCGSPRMGEEGYHQRVSGGVMQGLLEKKVEPIYPQVDASGTVVMMVCVDATGAVERVQVVSGPGPLRDAAGRAVSAWSYRPYLLNGVAVPVSTTVAVMFSR